MTILKKDSAKVRQPTLVGEIVTTDVLSGSKTVQIIELSVAAEKVTFQATGDLAGTVEFSLTGVDFKNSTGIGASNALVTFSSHMVRVLKITRTGGSGRLSISGK